MVEKGLFPIYDTFFYILSHEIARIAVPLFYFISGFLFFYKSDFSLASYKNKLKKRTRTLLLPYVFWNLEVLLLTLCTQLFIPSMTSGNRKLILDYGLWDWINVFWSGGGKYPMCYQFWFIRDLMIIVLATPVIYYLVKRCRIAGVLILGVLWLSGLVQDAPGLSMSGILFFSLGAYFSIHRLNFTDYFKKPRVLSLLLYIAVLGISTFAWSHGDAVSLPYLHNLGVIIGLITVVGFTAKGIETGKIHVNNLLSKGSFFVYAFHGMPIALITKLWLTGTPQQTEFLMIASNILIPLLVATLSIIIYSFMNKKFHKFTAMITGGR